MLDLSKVNKDWNLFLDRDGVVNEEREPYVLTKDDFEFYKGSLKAIVIFTRIFKHVFIATNQRGVARKLMTEKDLHDIHAKMLKAIEAQGGKIEKIYFNTAMNNDDPTRKPNPGMALSAIKDYPEIVPDKTIMVGNNISDMKFGRNAGFHTVLLTTTGTDVSLPDPLVDLKFDSLLDFAEALQSVVAPT
jgi:histidinol-phosphate phosphatase family protein